MACVIASSPAFAIVSSPAPAAAAIAQAPTQWTVSRSVVYETTTGQAVFDNRDAIMVDQTDTLQRALELMSAVDCTALPVRNKQQAFMGILTMADVVAHIAQWEASSAGASLSAAAEVSPAPATPSASSSSSSSKGSSIGGSESHRLLTSKVGDVLGAALGYMHRGSEERDIVVMEASERLLAAMKHLASKRVHHVLVHGKSSWRILSQWDVLMVLANAARTSTLGSIAEAPIAALGIINHNAIVSIPWSMRARNGFNLMSASGVSAMPIADEHGQLCGTLSSSDLRCITSDTFKAMSLPVMEFVKCANVLHRTQATALPSTPLAQVLASMKCEEVHRVWILDSERGRHVIGVVTLTDIIAAYLHWLDQPLHTSATTPAPATPAAAALAPPLPHYKPAAMAAPPAPVPKAAAGVAGGSEASASSTSGVQAAPHTTFTP